MSSRAWIAGLALSAMFLCVGCSSEEQLKHVENEVGDLKLEVFKLRTQLEDSSQATREDRAANVEARAQDRRFQADLQETLRQLQDSTRILNNRMGDSVVRPKSKAAVPEAAPPSSDDDKAYSAALLDYNRGNYPLASEGLELFLKSNPQSSHRPDAIFTLGLCWYNQKNFDKAKLSFEAILKDHANSGQFLPAKLKRAQCLARMGLKPAAITGFQEITQAFKGSPEARTAQQELADLGF